MILFNKRCDGEAARMRGFLSTVWYFTEVWTSWHKRCSRLKLATYSRHTLLCRWCSSSCFIKNMKNHTGYFGWDKCTQEEGLRWQQNDSSSCGCTASNGLRFWASNKQQSALQSCTFTSSRFRLTLASDYVHLSQGHSWAIMVLSKWTNMSMETDKILTSRLSAITVNLLFDKLAALSKFIPNEFTWKPRSVTGISRWKCTEFRTLCST